MSKKQRFTVLPALIAALSALAWHNGYAADDILLGTTAAVSSPTAGRNASNIVLGYSTYLEQINRQGGVFGRRIKIVNKDDNVEVPKMLALTEELIADKRVLALVGYLNTPGLAALAKDDLLAKKRIAMIAPVGAVSSTNFYPLRPSYNQEVEKLLQEARDTQKKRVALVYFNQTFGPPLYKYADSLARTMGVN